ncbi:hypothetical protein ABZ568_42330 [Streptomyces olindensis]|uniref:Uncharacterized protein n=1 Tax=Streptomyces olindensis TaxID=358823 RepID=A0ABV2Y9N9_9ACTN
MSISHALPTSSAPDRSPVSGAELDLQPLVPASSRRGGDLPPSTSAARPSEGS